jgi:hypothetical protein
MTNGISSLCTTPFATTTPGDPKGHRLDLLTTATSITFTSVRLPGRLPLKGTAVAFGRSNLLHHRRKAASNNEPNQAQTSSGFDIKSLYVQSS